VKGKELEFGRDAIKIFFFVFIYMSNERMFLLMKMLEKEEVIEGEVGAVFARAICGNGVISCLLTSESR
jgi:hypothetical protein